MITGLATRNNELIVFKGPNKGSIFRVQGSAEADWSLRPIITAGNGTGIGAINQQSIIAAPGGDVWFWDHFGIHSLVAVETFGDYKPRYLSDAIRTYFIKNLNHTRFEFVWGCNFAAAGYALWTCSRSGNSTHNQIIGLDYRFTPARFFFWPAYTAASLAMVQDTNRETVPWAGTYAGRVLRMNRTARDIATTAYTSTVTLPYLSYGPIFRDRVVKKGIVHLNPKGDTTATIGWTRDTNTQQTASVSQGGTATLGASSDEFTLNVDALGGGAYRPVGFDMSGAFKSLQIQMTQGGVDVDFEPHGLELEIEDAGVSSVVPAG